MAAGERQTAVTNLLHQVCRRPEQRPALVGARLAAVAFRRWRGDLASTQHAQRALRPARPLGRPERFAPARARRRRRGALLCRRGRDLGARGVADRPVLRSVSRQPGTVLGLRRYAGHGVLDRPEPNLRQRRHHRLRLDESALGRRRHGDRPGPARRQRDLHGAEQRQHVASRSAHLRAH